MPSTCPRCYKAPVCGPAVPGRLLLLNRVNRNGRTGGVIGMGWALTLVVAGLALLLVARLGIFALTLGLGLLPFLLIAGGVIWAVSTVMARRRNGTGGPADMG